MTSKNFQIDDLVWVNDHRHELYWPAVVISPLKHTINYKSNRDGKVFVSCFGEYKGVTGKRENWFPEKYVYKHAPRFMKKAKQATFWMQQEAIEDFEVKLNMQKHLNQQLKINKAKAAKALALKEKAMQRALADKSKNGSGKSNVITKKRDPKPTKESKGIVMKQRNKTKKPISDRMTAKTVTKTQRISKMKPKVQTKKQNPKIATPSRKSKRQPRQTKQQK